jgi:regulator of protease activity HflC (stomatin/prohibitin superfamily)
MGTDRSRRVLVPVTAYALLAAGAACFLAAACVAAPADTAALVILGSAFLIASGGFLGETVLMHVRARSAPWPADVPAPAEPTDEAWSITASIKAWRQRLLDRLARIDWVGAWAPAGLAFACSLVAGLGAVAVWHAAGRGTVASTRQEALGCLLVVVAFPLLWLDRLCAHLDGGSQPAMARLEVLLRVPLAASAALGLACLIRSFGYAWPVLIDRAVIVLIGLVAVEIMLRSAAQVFLPMPPVAERRSPATSAIARFIAPKRPRIDALGAGIQRQFGIDLSRSWALAFLLRASLPVALGLCLLGWLLTGLTTLGIDQRAIYERFGVPIAIEGPGLHLHLPWPFGIMRRVELGVVHEIPIVFPANGMGAADAGAKMPAQVPPAEAVPPASEDRLWDDSHPYEASYLIASASNGQQGFQIVNIDLRIVYRTDSSDAGALAAAYRVADPAALIRAAAGRMLVQHFSRHTLADVLGENRARFVGSFRAQLQQRLDRLQAGADIIAVVVEAIHPPPEAARAYHNVQAAEIRADALVSQSRGEAYTFLGKARQQSATLLDGAQADAAEQVDQAQAALTLFDGDHRAYLRGGNVFLTERWLGHLERDLAHTPLVIVDHRLNGPLAPTVDLRRFGTSVPPVVPVN